MSNFIQWKGTDVCIDLMCKCGASFHYDGYFLYHWECQDCGTIYKMADTIQMTEIGRDELGGSCCIKDELQ